MNTMTLNPKLGVLENMSAAVTTPRTKSPAAGRVRPRIRIRYVTAPRPAPRGTWSERTIRALRATLSENLLSWSLLVAGLAALSWLIWTASQFFLAWKGLANLLKAALL